MENKEVVAKFEGIVKDKLEGFEPPFNPEHWDKMAEKIEEWTEKERTFDKKMAQSVQQAMPDMPPPQWERMAAALDGHFLWPVKIFRYKLVECALLLLLLIQLTEMPFWEPYTEGGYPMPVRKLVEPDNVVPTIAVAAPKSVENRPQKVFKRSAPTAVLSFYPKEMPVSQPILVASASPLAALASVSPKMLKVPTDAVSVKKMPITAQPKCKSWEWGWFTGPALDNVFTNYTRDGHTIYDAQTVMNVSAGLYVGRKIDRLQTNIGLVYHSKAYIQSPIKNKVTQGSFLNGYTTTDAGLVALNILSAEINLQYAVMKRGSWSLYISGGVAGHAVMHTWSDKHVAFTDPLQNTTGTDPTKSSSVELARYGAGRLQGGRLTDGNYYTTAQMAIGIDYQMSKRTTLFVQPNHQMPIGRRGIGSRHDKIHSTNLYIGARFGF